MEVETANKELPWWFATSVVALGSVTFFWPRPDEAVYGCLFCLPLFESAFLLASGRLLHQETKGLCLSQATQPRRPEIFSCPRSKAVMDTLSLSADSAFLFDCASTVYHCANSPCRPMVSVQWCCLNALLDACRFDPGPRFYRGHFGS